MPAGDLTTLSAASATRTPPPACFVQSVLSLKLAEKDMLRHLSRGAEFVTGEGFPYLGRNYRLFLVDEQDVTLKLLAGRFRLLRSERSHARRHFVSWYIDRGREWMAKWLDRWTVRLSVKPAKLDFLDLGNRWGSATAGGRVNFHWATILLPVPLIDYVLVHEFAHLHEPGHTPEFWLRVERAMPDYEQRKEELARRGGDC